MADQSHSDHDTLSHTAGKLVWILLHTLLHIIDSNQFHHFHGTFLGFFFADFLIMGTKSFHKLISDGVNRIQTGHGILEDHSYFVSAERSHLFLGKRKDIFSLEGNGASDNFTWGLKKPHNRICLLALSRTRFSNNSHNFAIIKVIGDTTNGFYLAGRGKEGDFQVFYFQQFIFLFRHCSPPLLFLQLRIKSIAKSIAKQVECKDHNAQDHGRYDQSVSISVHTAKCVCCHGSKAWKRCGNTNSKVG